MCQGGTCRCRPQCDGKTCGPDGCGGSCGTCGAQEVCDGGTCLCTPDCGTKVCGGDGCGGSCGSCSDQGAATCGTTGACSDGRCERYASGTVCQAAVCTSETTLQPACTCDGQRGCSCPSAITCPSNQDCRNGACEPTKTPTCDCSNLNYCNGHGTCTAQCICACADGYSGVACSVPPVGVCSDHVECADCQNQASAGCVWCGQTYGGASNVCTDAEQCFSPTVACSSHP